MRLALVTGANRGIGHEVCRQLAAKGMRVVVTARDGAAAESAAAELKRQGLDVVSIVMEVTDTESVHACADRVTSDIGSVDVLVDNAAVLIPENQDLVSTPLDVFRRR